MTPEESDFLSELYHASYHKLLLHACAILQQRPLAETAVQEAFRIACQHMDRLQSSEKLVGWMKKTVEHTALHLLREQRRNRTLLLSLEEFPDRWQSAQLDSDYSDLRERCLTVVSQEEFELFLRIAEQGHTYVEEAKRLGISLGACYKRFERIRTKLRAFLSRDVE